MSKHDTIATQYVTCPSHEQLESAWFALMQGELGIARDRHVSDTFQALYDRLVAETKRGMPVFGADDEPMRAVSSDEVAKRLVAAYACIFYGA